MNILSIFILIVKINHYRFDIFLLDLGSANLTDFLTGESGIDPLRFSIGLGVYRMPPLNFIGDIGDVGSTLQLIFLLSIGFSDYSEYFLLYECFSEFFLLLGDMIDSLFSIFSGKYYSISDVLVRFFFLMGLIYVF